MKIMFELGARLRYWPSTMDKPYYNVVVLGYTKTGRVRIKFVTTGKVTNVKPSSLSVL